ncbi:nucleoside phosphorylase [Candidatus Saccharibacteria bacterium]|nr:nucleoside phosphorylase [Candidatus Saccharibacteria bacterium]
MITDSFDDKSEAKINPIINKSAYELDACILIFSDVIERSVLGNYECEKIGEVRDSADIRSIYKIDYKGKKIGFFKTFVGAPSCVRSIERSFSQIKTKRLILFGGAGCLDKRITHGKVMVPTEAYRDEGTSYHYAAASDYIKIDNHGIVADYMKENNIPFIEGKTWTTDAFFRETLNNFGRRKKDGCISVEMECSAVQALCNFRKLELYAFFTSGDLLDGDKWNQRHVDGDLIGTQHDYTHFDIAIGLANYVCEH